MKSPFKYILRVHSILQIYLALYIWRGEITASKVYRGKKWDQKFNVMAGVVWKESKEKIQYCHGKEKVPMIWTTFSIKLEWKQTLSMDLGKKYLRLDGESDIEER